MENINKEKELTRKNAVVIYNTEKHNRTKKKTCCLVSILEQDDSVD